MAETEEKWMTKVKVTRQEWDEKLREVQRWQLNPESVRKPDFSNYDLKFADLSGQNLYEVNFEGADLSGANLMRVDLSGANLKGARLGRANFRGATLKGADLSGASLDEALLEGADIENVNFSGAVLNKVYLGAANLTGTDFSKAVLNDTNLQGAQMVRTKMSEASLVHAQLDKADLTGADLSEANLTHASLKQALLTRANLSGASVSEATLQEADLTAANLCKTDLTQSSLQMTRLRDAVMKETNLSRANLAFSDLTGASLRHSKWDKANLSGAKLTGADLRDSCLRNARLEAADLSRCRLMGADLSRTQLDLEVPGKVNLAHADLTGADLTDADLTRADLTGTNFRNALLIRAGLSGTKTAGMHLGGAVVTNAELPEEIRAFDGLKAVSEASLIARKLYAWLIAGMAFSGLTIAATDDIRLLTNATTSPLPVIQTPFPIAGFYFFAPVILLGLYLYFQLQLQHQWRLISKLPAVFPDGTPLDEKIYPWLLNTWVRNFSTRKNKRRRFLTVLKDNLSLEAVLNRLRNLLVVTMCWYALPMLLAAFWMRYLNRHDWTGTRLQIMLLVLSIFFAIALHLLAKQTLRNRQLPAWSVLVITLLIVLPVLSVTATLSHKAIEGNLKDPSVKLRLLPWQDGWIPANAFGALPEYKKLPQGLLDRLKANLSQRDVSVKPVNYDPDDPNSLKWVRGAKLERANLNYLLGEAAFMDNAKLRGASLVGANLHLAQLKGANLRDANLSGADLRFADLSGADLTNANLTGADLRETNLESADLTGVDFKDADLTNAEVSNTVFYDAQNLTKEQVQLAIHWKEGYYEKAFKIHLGIFFSSSR